MSTKCPRCNSPLVYESTNKGTFACTQCHKIFSIIPGVGPDAPTITNAAGARQSDSPYRLDLVPPLALLAVGAVLKHGAEKYGVDNWRGIPTNDHLNHALTHIFAFLSGDTQDDHLEHAATRIMMALEMKEKK